MDYSIFKAYDIRGIYPSQIDEDAVYKIAQAYAKFTGAKNVALGRDVRTSGNVLWEAVKQGLVEHGVDVIDIGIVSTDMLYFAVANYGYDGGITISASHNPAEYNGMKMVKAGAVPISGDSGIREIRQLVEAGYNFVSSTAGRVKVNDITTAYLDKCLSLIDLSLVKHFKVVVNSMFGPAVQNVKRMGLPLNLIAINEKLDGTFPKGQPDPLLEANRHETIELIKKEKADFGCAWDGDADRFFLFDENGRFIPGYYLTAFLGSYFAKKYPNNKVLYDPRLTWATIDAVSSSGGVPLVNKVGHSFIKERMRGEQAVFAGENSGHYYFRDYFYCDNGLIPFLILLQIFSEMGSDFKVSKVFDKYFEQYPISGELNTKLDSQEKVLGILKKIEDHYSQSKMEKIDGLSIENSDWRANVRASNTEPLIRLNVEAKNEKVLKEKTEELLKLIQGN